MTEIMIIDAATGNVTLRDFSADELAQRKIDADNAKADVSAKETAEAADQATITAARDHASSLGFTDAMLAVMYPNLTP